MWSGTQGKTLGLVDEFGSLDDALRYAADKAHITGSYRLTEFPKSKNLSEALAEFLGKTVPEGLHIHSEGLATQIGRQIDGQLNTLNAFDDPQGVYARMPTEPHRPINAMAHTLQRDCPATAIPAGDKTALPTCGLEVLVTQTLGGNVTVRTDRGLFQITRENASAIPGLELKPDAGTSHAEFSEAAVWDALKTCFDPEIPVNIVDLGLIYDLSIEPTSSGGHQVEVKMTLTAPGCGMGRS